jgi:hypothetical protein
LHVLITNNTLAERTGTALYVRDLAERLLARGHKPCVYSPVLGEVARGLARAGIEVVADPRKLSGTPDLVHGHHEIATMAALLHFRDVPGIFVCHDRRHHSDIPPTLPRIRRYVAVDYQCRERFGEHGIAEERIRVVPNGVDLRRFRPRSPLPERPRRALVFSNNASERTYLPVVREACVRTGLSLDVIGAAAGTPSAEPEAVLGQYDLVLAKGRCAVEAVAVGAAVVLCDALGTGPLVTTDNLETLLRFDSRSKRLWHKPLDADLIAAEMARYDARDATEVSRRVRRWADLDGVVQQLLAIYDEVLTEHAAAGRREADEAAAVAAYWRSSRQRRLRDRLKRLPGVGPLLLALKQKLAPYRPQF